MNRKTFIHKIIVLLIFSILISSTFVNVYAIDDIEEAKSEADTQYSVLAIADYYNLNDLEFQDANVIDDRFDDFGWDQGQYETNSSVQHWDFTEYGTDWESDDGDFLYYMGHAGSSGTSNGVTIYSPLMLQAWNYYANSHGRSYCNPDRVGTYSNSNWDTDLEWAMFAACKTLKNNGSATRWGSCLYNGMHQLLGYNDTSHGHPDDTIIAHSFTNRAMGTSIYCQVFTSFRYAHINPIFNVPGYGDTDDFAHDDNDTIWAGVMHEGNYNDHLHGISTGATADITNSVSDVRYYDYENWTKYAGDLLFDKSSSKQSVISTMKTEGGTTLNIYCSVPKSIFAQTVNKVKSKNLSATDIAKKYENVIKLSDNEYLIGKTAYLTVNNNIISYTTEPELEETSIDLVKSYDVAMEILQNVYGMQSEYQLDEVFKFRSLSLFDENSQPLDIEDQTEKVYGYSFNFRTFVNGSKILGNDVIKVEVLNGAPTSIFSNMNEYKLNEEKTFETIDASKALSVFGEYVDFYLPEEKQIDICEIELAYRNCDETNELEPVWFIEYSFYENGRDVSVLHYSVNAITGEPLIEIPNMESELQNQEYDYEGISEANEK